MEDYLNGILEGWGGINVLGDDCLNLSEFLGEFLGGFIRSLSLLWKTATY